MMLNFIKRVREVNLKYSSLSGVVNINSVRQPIQFESSLERDFIYLLEFDREIKQYLEQPLEIGYSDDLGKNRRYIPDFIVFYYSRQTEVIEIKYESTLIDKKDELKFKFSAATEYCNKQGFLFKIITNKYIREERGIELQNSIFLSRYKCFFDNMEKNRIAHSSLSMNLILLSQMMRNLGEVSVRELVCKSTPDEHKRAELIFLTWYMVASNLLYVNMMEKLTIDSLVCLG